MRTRATRNSGQGARALDQIIRAQFSSGEPGLWYDISDMSTLFQDAAGTVPVTGLEQPVGRVVDKSGRGNHATQATTTARPVLSAQVNILTFSEEFDNAAWIKGTDASVTPNQAVAPDGQLTADRITFSADATTGDINGIFTTVAGRTYAESIWLWADVGQATITRLLFADDAGSTQGDLVVNLTTTPTRYSVSAVAPTGTSRLRLRCGTGQQGKSFYAWGAQANTGALAAGYQRTAAAGVYNAVGFPNYLRFDGVDDWLGCNLDLASAQKVASYFSASVLNPGGTRILFEASTNSISTAGAIALLAGPDVRFRSGGTTPIDAYAGAMTSAPKVWTGLGEIATPLVSIRENSVLFATSNASQGTGNYGNLPFYIGSRAATTLFAQMSMYGLIVRGGNTHAGDIAKIERWLAQKSGVML